ncbi:MAG: MATE family efflux transporter [Bernardetiaceae bacterium]|jgi:MATE family multidrug resistance protein|nr:MATE family efflux transporter [Bernardetiaceae bacterium]
MQRYQAHYAKTLHLALPIVAGQLSTILISVSDNAMVGQYSALSLAGAAFANSVLGTFLVFGLGVTWSLTPLVATAEAAGQTAKLRSLMQHSLVVYAGLGAVLVALATVTSFFLHRFGQTPEVATLARPYFLVVALSLLPVMVFQTFKQFMEGLSHTREPMYVNFGGAVLNVIFNYLLIFGKFGFPALGLLGAGLATLAARVLMAGFIAVRFYTSPKFAAYRPAKLQVGLQWAELKRLTALGIPVGLQSGFEVGAFSFVAIMVGWLGTLQLAAHQIALNVASVTFFVALGLSSAAAIRTGQFVGKRDRGGLRLAGFSGYHLVIGFMASCALLIAVGRTWLPGLYLEANDPLTPQIADLAAVLLVYAAIFQISDGAQAMGMGVLRGLQDVKGPTLIALVAYWVVGIPLGYWLGFHWGWGAKGVWLGLAAGLSFAAVFLALRFHDKSRRATL